MNYTQAYKSLLAAGSTADDARRALERAEIAPANALTGRGWVTVTHSAKRGFFFTDDKEEK